MKQFTRKKAALTAGCLLITMAIVAGIGYGYAFTSFYKDGDIAGTLNTLNIGGYAMLKVTIVAFTIILIMDVIIAWALHEFFKNSNQSFSSLVAVLRLIYTAILGSSIFYLLSVLESMQHVSKDGELIMHQLNLFLHTWSWGLIIFAVHLFLLGILISRSGLFPKSVGYITCFAAVCYFFHHTGSLFFFSYQAYKSTAETILALPMALGELVLAVCLIGYFLKKHS